jgi:hypothetical protein
MCTCSTGLHCLCMYCSVQFCSSLYCLHLHSTAWLCTLHLPFALGTACLSASLRCVLPVCVLRCAGSTRRVRGSCWCSQSMPSPATGVLGRWVRVSSVLTSALCGDLEVVSSLVLSNFSPTTCAWPGCACSQTHMPPTHPPSPASSTPPPPPTVLQALIGLCDELEAVSSLGLLTLATCAWPSCANSSLLPCLLLPPPPFNTCCPPPPPHPPTVLQALISLCDELVAVSSLGLATCA